MGARGAPCNATVEAVRGAVKLCSIPESGGTHCTGSAMVVSRDGPYECFCLLLQAVPTVSGLGDEVGG